MFKAVKAIAAVSLITLASAGANAANQDNMTVNEEGNRTVFVSYDDLNLDSASGMKSLERRVRGAVKKVCGYTGARQSVREASLYRQCANAAASAALASVDAAGRTRLAVRSLPAKAKQ